MKRFLSAAFCLVWLFAACSPALAGGVKEEDYPVYDSVLEIIASFDVNAKRFVVLSQTGPALSGISAEDLYTSLSTDLPDISPETAADFLARNTEEYPLKDNFDPERKILLLSQQELDEQFGTPIDWNQFNLAYPTAAGFYTISCIGYNNTGDQALIYVTDTSETVGGEGVFFLLVIKDGEWKLSNFTVQTLL